jgi:hypothetical protein
MQSARGFTGDAPAARRPAQRTRTKAEKRVYPPEHVFSPAQEQTRHARLVRRLSAKIAAGHSVPGELRGMHRQACESICAIATQLQRCSSAANMHTYINAYFLWHAWMQAMFAGATLRESDPKHASINLFTQLSPHKMTVMIPALCFWISIKCTETWSISVNDLACMIHAIEHSREDRTGAVYTYTLRELCQAEDAVLQLLDWDILRSQDNIDGMEDILEAHFTDTYSSAKVQSQVVLLLFHMFNDIGA